MTPFLWGVVVGGALVLVSLVVGFLLAIRMRAW
jgi:hypothetical protein